MLNADKRDTTAPAIMISLDTNVKVSRREWLVLRHCACAYKSGYNARCRLIPCLIVMTYVIDPVHRAMCFHEDRLCATNCGDVRNDGNYVSCDDCRRYFVCRGSSQTLHTCPHEPNYGFNADTKKCQYKSPHCFVCTGRSRVIPLQILPKASLY